MPDGYKIKIQCRKCGGTYTPGQERCPFCGKRPKRLR